MEIPVQDMQYIRERLLFKSFANIADGRNNGLTSLEKRLLILSKTYPRSKQQIKQEKHIFYLLLILNKLQNESDNIEFIDSQEGNRLYKDCNDFIKSVETLDSISLLDTLQLYIACKYINIYIYR